MPKKTPEASASKPSASSTMDRADSGDDYDAYGASIDRYRNSEDDLSRSDSGLGDDTYREAGDRWADDTATTTEPEHRVYFGYNAESISGEGLRILEDNARWLLKQSYGEVVVEGHADERGTREYNLALGQKRAESVKQTLVDAGVPAHRVRTISYGKERPLVPGHSEFAWTKNRRVDLLIQ